MPAMIFRRSILGPVSRALTCVFPGLTARAVRGRGDPRCLSALNGIADIRRLSTSTSFNFCGGTDKLGRMLAHLRGDSSSPLLEKTIGTCFRDSVARMTGQDMITVPFQNVRLNWEEVAYRAERFAQGLLNLGFQPGDRLGVWMPNNHEWVVTMYGSALVGVVLVNVNPHNRLHELEHALNLVGCRGIITVDEHQDPRFYKTIRELCPELDSAVPGKLESARIPTLRAVITVGHDETPPGVLHFDAVYAASVNRERLHRIEKSLEPDQPINIQFTSGTTGLPKAATLTHRNVINNGRICGDRMLLTPADRLCLPVPLYHTFGTSMGNICTMIHGVSSVYPASGFDPERTLAAVAAERCTMLYGVPTMFIAMLEHPKFSSYDLRSLRTGIMAGSVCPTDIMRRVVDEMHLSEITIGYGMTETSPLSFMTFCGDSLERRVSTLGTILPHVECKVIDPGSGETVAVGETGELCTKGYLVMKGYWGEPAKTAAVIDGDGFMHTGDLVTVDAEGYARIVGRSKDIIIRAGENIAPREVEEFLHTHPNVKDVSVLGVPDAKYGEQVCAWIITRDGSALSHDDILRFCKGEISSFKIPKYVHCVDSFPLTVSGKHQKFKMREVSAQLIKSNAL